jgi:radical SAM protein with 4Fe4S-binding SPASM domain
VRVNLNSQSAKKAEEIFFYLYSLGVNRLDLSVIWQPLSSKRNLDKKLVLGSCEIYEEKIPKIIELGEIFGIRITTGGTINYFETMGYYCEGCGFNRVLTVDNRITSCPEIYKSDAEGDVFIYGDLKDGKIQIDREKLGNLRKRTWDSLEECQDCTLLKVCAGQCPARAIERGKDYFSIGKERCYLTRKFFHNYLISLINRNYFRKKPYLKENPPEFRMLFNRFELCENRFEGNPYLRIGKGQNLNQAINEIKKYDEKNPGKIFFLSLSGLSPKNSAEFLGKMAEERIPFIITKPLFNCDSVNLIENRLTDFRIPKSCGDCHELYGVMEDGRIRFCTGQIGRKLDDYETRDEIYGEFMKLGNKMNRACGDCIHKLRGNCDGKYC